MRILRARDRNPDVSDDAGTGLFQDREGFARRNVAHVGVSTGPIPARDTIQDIVVWLGQIREQST